MIIAVQRKGVRARLSKRTFVQIRTQIHRPPVHPYRRLFGIIVIINKHMKYANRAKVKCFCLTRQKREMCPQSSVTLHPDHM